MRQLHILFVLGSLSLLTGCATLTEGGAKVKVVDPAELVTVKAQCKYIGPVEGSAEGDDSSGAKAMAIVDMKNHAAEIEANVVVSKLHADKSVGFFAPSHGVKGQGFFCIPDVMNKLTDAESM